MNEVEKGEIYLANSLFEEHQRMIASGKWDGDLHNRTMIQLQVAWPLAFKATVKAVNSHETLVKKLEEIHDITQDTTLGVECWQKLQNIAATAAAALASIKETAK